MENNEIGKLDSLNTHNDVAQSREQVSAAAFLQDSGLGFLAQKFEQAGFQSIADVLALTPRKYAEVGVDLQVGTKLRLERL